MKRGIVFLLIAFVAMTAVSCRNKKENEVWKTIMGKWSATKAVIKAAPGTFPFEPDKKNPTAIDTTYHIKPPQYFYIIFHTPDRLTVTRNVYFQNEKRDIHYAGSFKIQGNQILLKKNGDFKHRLSFSYKLDKDHLTLHKTEKDSTTNKVIAEETLFFTRDTTGIKQKEGR